MSNKNTGSKKLATAHTPVLSNGVTPGTKPGVTVEVVGPEPTLSTSPLADGTGATKRTRTPAAGVPTREEVLALVTQVGLPLHEKSSTHAGDPKSVRLVIPRAASVTRLYVYQLEDAALPGYKAPDVRKAEGLGKVSHVADVTSMDQVRALVSAVAVANGLKAPKAKAPRTRKSSPARGLTQTTTGGETKPAASEPAQTTESVVEGPQ